jgi:hypothetical protein
MGPTNGLLSHFFFSVPTGLGRTTFHLPPPVSRDSAVGIATGYGLDDREVGVRVPGGSRIFSSARVQTGCGVHPTYPMGSGGSFPGGKAAGA